MCLILILFFIHCFEKYDCFSSCKGLADRFHTRQEAFENGKNFAIEAGCHEAGTNWDSDSVNIFILIYHKLH